jgi:hypothetical protein
LLFQELLLTFYVFDIHVCLNWLNASCQYACLQRKYSAMRKFAWMRHAEHDGLADGSVTADMQHWASRPLGRFSSAQRQTIADEIETAAMQRAGYVRVSECLAALCGEQRLSARIQQNTCMVLSHLHSLQQDLLPYLLCSNCMTTAATQPPLLCLLPTAQSCIISAWSTFALWWHLKCKHVPVDNVTEGTPRSIHVHSYKHRHHHRHSQAFVNIVRYDINDIIYAGMRWTCM